MVRRRSRKGAKRLLLALALCVPALPSWSQQQPMMHQVQAVVQGLRTAGQAHEVDVVLLNEPGVELCRTDYNTRNLLLQVRFNAPLTEARLSELLLPFGLTVRCYERKPLGSEPFVHLDPRHCDELPQVR